MVRFLSTLHNINRVKRLSSRGPNAFNRGTDRQVYPEAGALAVSGFNADGAVHPADPAPDHSEADAHPRHLPAVQTFKNAKNTLVMFRCDADAVVFHPKTQFLCLG